MNRLIESIFGLRAEERPLVLLMALYNYLLLITFYLLKPVRDSLFLAERGAAELPFVFILTTALIVPVAGFHTRAARSYDLDRLVDGVSVLLVVNLVALRGLVAWDAAWVTYALYAWVSIYGVLVTSQFWLLANALFTPAQSKRVFTLLSAGAILGAITGGEVTGLLIDAVGMDSHNLMWIAAALLAASIGLVNYIRQRHSGWSGPDVPAAPDPDASESAELGLKTAFDTLLSSRHLWVVVGIIAVTVLTTTIVDFQFKTVAHRAYPDEASLASFLGRFYGRVSMAALIVQFALAPYLLRVFGVGGALSLLPAMLAVGTVGMLVAPGLVAAALLRGSEQSLKHSIDRTGRELLFVPIDLERKKRVKVFIDLFVDQGTQGLGGVLLLFLTFTLGLSVTELSVVVLGFIGVWALLAYRARHSYTDQFRRQLREQNRADASAAGAPDAPLPDELNRLIDALCSRGERATRAALDELEGSQTLVPVDALRHVLDHQSPSVRAQAIRVLRKRKVAGLSETVASYLLDLDPDVQLEAARYLYRNLSDNRHELLERGLRHEEPTIRAATVALIAKEGGPDERALVDPEILHDLVEREGPGARERRVQAARLLGVIQGDFRNELLRRLLRDDDPGVAREAIASAGKTRDRAFVMALLRHLQDEALEAEARAALVAYGLRILGMLYDHLIDEHVDLRIRCRIPAILARQPCTETVQVLFLAVNRVPIPVRHAIVRALSRLQARDKTLDFSSSTLERAFRREARHYAALGQIVALCHRGGADRHGLVTALRALRREALERIFRMLGLHYNQQDIYDAYLGMVGADDRLRASAIEFVDDLMDWRTSRLITPLLDDPRGQQAVRHGERLFGLTLHHEPDALRYLLEAQDPRLNVLALEQMGQRVPARLRAQQDAISAYLGVSHVPPPAGAASEAQREANAAG